MNSETSLIITIGVAVILIAIIFGFSNTVLTEGEKSIIGGEDQDGIIDCSPTEDGEDCDQVQSSSTDESKLSLEKTRKVIKV